MMRIRPVWSLSFLVSLGCLLIGAVLLSTLAGCPVLSAPGPSDVAMQVGDSGTPTAPTVGILNILTDAAFSDDVALTIFYSVPAGPPEVVAFYRVLDLPASIGGQPIGIEELIAENLPAGESQSFVFNTTDLRPGFYQLGIRAGGVEYFSQGTLEIQGPPAPLFLEPSSDLSVRAGQDVKIVADVGDPQGRAQWRLFFQEANAEQLEEGQAPGGELLGIRLAEGSGNSVDFTWSTTNIEPGDYRLGLSATDTGFSISEVVSSGQADAIVTAYSDAVVTILASVGSSQPPTIELTSSDQTAFVGDSVEIGFTAQTFDGDEFLVIVYYVFQDEDEGAKTTFATVTDPEVRSKTFDTQGLAAGIYEIGATISDGLNPVVEVPESGRVLVMVIDAASAKLSVDQPTEDDQVAQGDVVTIEWTTNVPSGEGRSVRVFVRSCTAPPPAMPGPDEECPAQVCAGPDIEILTDAGLNITSTTWDTSGLTSWHQIAVELTLPELTTPKTVCAPGAVRVTVLAPQFWVGSLGKGPTSRRQGELFQGVNFQDNAATFLTAVGDYDRDGKDDYLIGARYGKPFFQNPSGIGIGEAYIIFGDDRRNQTHNLNTVGTAQLRGVVAPGIRPRDEAQEETDGLGAVRTIPDQDGDGIPELMFGFPYTDSRGHTYSLVVQQQPEALITLEKARQFVRGGVVIVSSQTPSLSSPPTPDEIADLPPGERAVIFLDLVGQNFRKAEPLEDDFGAVGSNCAPLHRPFLRDLLEVDDMGMCVDDDDGFEESFFYPWGGFNRALSDNYIFTSRLFDEIIDVLIAIPSLDLIQIGCANALIFIFDDPFLESCADALGIQLGGISRDLLVSAFQSGDEPLISSGFYPLRYCTGDLSGVLVDNEPRPPFGARIIGRGAGTPGMESTTADRFGTTIATSGEFILVAAPNRQPEPGELIGVDSPPTDPGLIYLVRIGNLWSDWRTLVEPLTVLTLVIVSGEVEFQFTVSEDNEDEIVAPPMPYQYQVDTISQCGRADLLERFPSPFKILGEEGQNIENVEGTPDFNLDQRDDFVIGAPLGNNGDGVVYVAYRRDPEIEGDYLLSKLSPDPTDVERLAGLRVNGRSQALEGFGEVIARSRVVADASGNILNESIDFNGDGFDDLILGNPNAFGGLGEVVIIFATNDLISPQGGFDLDTLLATDDADGNPRAIRIVGAQAGDLFGFNIAVTGDFDGDGTNDLLVAAPNASPQFDSNDDGIPDTNGVDEINLADLESAFGDGIKDDVNGDGVVDDDDNLVNAGLVYLILGSNNLPSLAGPTNTILVSRLGTSSFRGLIFVGRTAGDQLGGGVEIKRSKRSFGVGPAGDVDGDGREDILLGSILADPDGRVDAGEAYLIYGFTP